MLKKWSGVILVEVILGFQFVHLHALDIALSGEGVSGSGGGKIGVVDMQKIYDIAPQTVNAKEDYLRRLEQKKAFLDQKEKDLESIRSRIMVLETTMKLDPNAEPPEELALIEASTVPRRSVTELKAELESKEAEYKDARKLAMEDLAAFEKTQNQVIFGKIYQSLQELATEEQVTIIVDKSSVLFGAAEVDLTPKLQARIRGY